jgi:hypothetical protein
VISVVCATDVIVVPSWTSMVRSAAPGRHLARRRQEHRGWLGAPAQSPGRPRHPDLIEHMFGHPLRARPEGEARPQIGRDLTYIVRLTNIDAWIVSPPPGETKAPARAIRAGAFFAIEKPGARTLPHACGGLRGSGVPGGLRGRGGDHNWHRCELWSATADGGGAARGDASDAADT